MSKKQEQQKNDLEIYNYSDDKDEELDKVEYFIKECDHIYINGKVCYIVGV